MNTILRLFLGAFSLLLVASCSSDMVDKLTPVPIAYGKVNELVVVADTDIWKGPVGDTLRYYLSSAYIILPQPEPLLDLRYYSPKELMAVKGRQNFRNYLMLANLTDKDSPTTQLVTNDIGSEGVRRAKETPSFNLSIGNNKWAQDQILMYQFAFSDDQLIERIKKNAPVILNRVNKHDSEIVDANIYQGGINSEMVSLVNTRMGVDLKVPYDYFLALDDTTNNTIWLRKETSALSANIFIHRYPYVNKDQFSKSGIKKILNELGLYVSTDVVGTYKHINDVDLPMYTTNVELDGNFAVESRGIWEIVNDYMGGPYISYSVLDPKTNEIILVEGFVHAPSKKKRDYMQQLEYIFKTLKI
jgi:hypothetical protein